MPARSFHVITVANDLAEHAVMKNSFVAAGFTDDVARYVVHDNSQQNVIDPYQVLRSLNPDPVEPYTILCHQDVRLNLGHGAMQLIKCLDELTLAKPDWALAGNAGTRRNGGPVMHIDDPWGPRRQTEFPIAVISLDENFMVIRRDAGRLASDGLSGFHLYGTDACLNAIANGRTAYVIDFLLTHLSFGKPESADFQAARKQLIDLWRPRLLIGVVCSICTEMRFSRWRWLERLLNIGVVGQLTRRVGLGLIFFPGKRCSSRSRDDVAI